MKWPERWLAVQLRPNGKNRIRSYLQRYGSHGRTAAGTAMAQQNFSRMQHNSYYGYGILTEFSQWQWWNGNGSTATEGWKPGVTLLKAECSQRMQTCDNAVGLYHIMHLPIYSPYYTSHMHHWVKASSTILWLHIRIRMHRMLSINWENITKRW